MASVPPFHDPRIQAQDETVEAQPFQEEGPGLPPPPRPGLPPPPKPHLLEQLAPFMANGTAGAGVTALPGLLAGLIGGSKSNVGRFGMGMLEGSNKSLMEANSLNRQREFEVEQNRIKNIGGRIEKMRRLASTNPEYAQVVRAYDQALMDGNLTAKEAARLSEQADGLPDPEGALQALELKRKTDEMIRLKETEDKLRRSNYVDTPYGRMDADEWARVQASMAGQQMSAQNAAMMEAGRERRFQEGQDRADARFQSAQERLGSQFNTKQDAVFQSKLNEYYGAEEALNKIEDSLARFQNAGWTSPVQKALAAQELMANTKGLSTTIGRNLGERGVFTDQDRAVFSQIITPGLIISEVEPKEAQRRIGSLKSLLAKVKNREIDAYQRINPNTKLDFGAERPGLPPPPKAGGAPTDNDPLVIRPLVIR